VLIGDSNEHKYDYVFRIDDLKMRQLKTLSYAEPKRHALNDWSGCVGCFGGIPLVYGVVWMFYGAISHDIEPFFAGLGCSVGGTSIVIPTIVRFMRGRKYKKLARKSALDRSQIVSFHKEDDRWVSDSYSLTALLQTEFGNILATELTRRFVANGKNISEYLRYSDINPEDELFPKLKPILNAYLIATADRDMKLAKFESSGTPSTVNRIHHEIRVEAVKASNEMRTVTEEHKAIRQVRTNEIESQDRVIADQELDSLPPLSIEPKLLPSR
jgi:hypothetical protein